MNQRDIKKPIEIMLVTQNQNVTPPEFVRTQSEREEVHKADGEHQHQQQPAAPERLKSRYGMIFIGHIISLSAINLGYSLKQITSVPIDTIVAEYNVTISSFAALSILIGIMPVGAVLGVLITAQLIKKTRRITGIYIFTLVNCFAALLININQFPSLIMGRFVQGICIGFYAGIAPIYLRQIAPKQLRRMLGLFFSLGKIHGVLFVILLQTLLRKTNTTTPIGYRFTLCFTAIFSVIQAILIFFFGSDTPTQLIQRGQNEKAREIIEKFYKQEYVEQVYNEYIQQNQAAKGNQQQQKKQEPSPNDDKYQTKEKKQEISKQNLISEVVAVTPDQPSIDVIKQEERRTPNKPVQELESDIVSESDRRQPLTFEEQKSMLFCLGVHMCALRQYCGGNVLLIQGGIFITTFNPSLGQWTSLIINFVQYVAILFGIGYLQKIIGKKPIFIFSLATMSVLNFAMVTSMIFHQVAAAFVLMCIFMIIFGGAFINQNWAYPSEVIPASESRIPNIVHWLTLSTANLVPPLVSGAMPNNNPFPVFIFFGIYCFIGFIHVRRSLQQTDGLTYMQIVKSMK